MLEDKSDYDTEQYFLREREEKASIMELVDLVCRLLCTRNYTNACESTEDSAEGRIRT